jgi:hypothetical protein
MVARVWSDLDDEIIGGDLTAALAYATAAGGAVVTPVAPVGLRDRPAGTVGFTTSHTGWLQDGVYAPHTETGFRAPANKTILLLANGFLARRGLKRARATGRG